MILYHVYVGAYGSKQANRDTVVAAIMSTVYDEAAGGTSPVMGPSASVCEMSPKLWKSDISARPPDHLICATYPRSPSTSSPSRCRQASQRR